MCVKKIIFGILLNEGKYLSSIIDDSVITCDEIIETTKTLQEKKQSQQKALQQTLTKKVKT